MSLCLLGETYSLISIVCSVLPLTFKYNFNTVNFSLSDRVSMSTWSKTSSIYLVTRVLSSGVNPAIDAILVAFGKLLSILEIISCIMLIKMLVM